MPDRDENGRFVPGHAPSNNGKGGRKARKREEQYLNRMIKVVTLKDWETITLTAVARAKAGEKAARQWLSDYLLGPPVQRLEADIESDNRLLIEILGGYRNTDTD